VDVGDVPASTRTIVFHVEFFDNDIGINLAYINKISWEHLPNTTILNYIRAGMEFPKRSNVYVIEDGEVIDLVIYNDNPMEHPIHMHGHDFWVLAMGNSGDGNFDPNRDPLNTKNPILRDTVTANPTSYVVLRFVANNPGAWFFHCHIDWHLMAGFAAVLVESPEKVREQFGTTPTLEFCPHPTMDHNKIW